MILVRHLPKQSYGIYLQIMFLANVVMSVLSIGMPRSIYYFMPRVTNKKKFVFHSFLITNALGLLALIVIITGRAKIGMLFNNTDIVIGLCFLAFYVFLSTNREIYSSVLLSTGNGKTLAFAGVILSILFLVSIMTPLFLRLGLLGIFWGILVFYVVQYAVTGFLALRNAEGNLSGIVHSECLAEQLKYMLPLGAISLVSLFSSSIDRLIVTFFMGIDNFALYDRGAMKIPVISSLSITVGAVIMPKLVDYYKNNNIKELLRIWHVSIEKVALIIFPCFVFLFIFAQQIITLLYTDAFENSVIIFRIYLLILLFSLTIYGNIFNATNRNTWFLCIHVMSVLLYAPLCLMMVKLYGNTGPAVATVMLYVGLSVANLLTIKHILSVKIKDVFPWGFLSKLMVCSIVSGIIPFFIGNMIDLPKFLILLICFPVYFFTYYFIADHFSMIKEDDKQTIFKWTGINWMRKQMST